METVKKRRPFGFYICALSFSFERMAFYTVKYLVAIWIAIKASSGGLGLTDVEGSFMAGQFVAWTYITPIIGGYIADRWVSPKLCIVLGMILMGAGYVCAWQATSLTMIWVMIVLVALGTGLFKGNLSGVVGQLFHSSDELDSAFSIQYSFVNIGSFVGTTFIALLATTGVTSYQTVFLICGIFLFIDAIWFGIIGKHPLSEVANEPFKKDKRDFAKQEETNAPLTSGDKKRIAAILLVTVFSIVFWMLWYMAYMPAYYHFGYGDGDSFLNRADWHIGSFLVPTAWFDSLNALVCMSLGPILAIVWAKLAARPKGDLSMYKKTGLGCGLLGVSYVVMAFADTLAGESGQTSLIWIILVCLLMSVGEMVFSPLGNSFINKLAPAKLLGTLLGVWPVAVYFSQILYPKLYAWTKTQSFTFAYTLLGIIVIAFGIVLWVISKKLDDWADEE